MRNRIIQTIGSFSLSLSLSLSLIPTSGPRAQFADRLSYSWQDATYDLPGMMTAMEVPGFSFLLAQADGSSETILRGHRGDAARTPLTATTPFPVGAMSGAPVCFAVLRLADRGAIDLDGPVDRYLTTRRLPDSRLLPFGKVTVRDILLYRRRLWSGYKPEGYAADAPLPSFAAVWAGTAPATTPPIEVKGNLNLGGESQYANLLILQQLLEDHYQEPLDAILQREVFDPLGMDHSFYAAELTADRAARVPLGHYEDGTAVPGGYRRYPELGAAGLWTTPADYAKLVRYVMDAARGRDNRLLTKDLARAGLSRAGKGFRSLLFNVNEYGNPYWGGNCKGFYASMQAWIEEDVVAVGMANRDLCWPLVNGTLWQVQPYVKAGNSSTWR